MQLDAARSLVLLLAPFGLSLAAVVLLSRFASALGLVDHPGGRKEHARAVPLVGGLAIFAAILVAAYVSGLAAATAWFLFALSLVIAAGFWDDVTEISPRLKLAIQVGASAIMIWGAGVELRTVGDLTGLRPIGLWIFSVPMTIFAVVGVVNAFNMLDGMDGLGGSVALVAFGWYALVAAATGLEVQAAIALVFFGAVAGFLLFNLRFPWQPHARVFLGDAGSLMIGFALGWLAIDLTQGTGRQFPPIAALWIVLLPLADCVSLMARRIRAGRSPFAADRRHVHHYLLARGLTSSQALAVLVGLSTVFGAVGFFGWWLRVPEPYLFWAFFAGFFAYHFWIQRAWRRVDRKLEETARLRALLAGDEEVAAAS